MRKLIVFKLLALLIIAQGGLAAAQQTPPEPTPQAAPEEAGEEPVEGEEAEEEEVADEADEDEEADEAEPVPAAQQAVDAAAEAGQAQAEPAQEEPAQEEPVDDEAFEPAADFEGSPIADIADEEFVPLEDIEEGALEQIIPAKVYPYLEWEGSFRVRSEAAVNYDLDTGGTSAVLPPAGAYAPTAAPADPGADTLWSTDMRLRLDPTLHITDTLSVHVELDLLDNVVFGTLPASQVAGFPFERIGAAGQMSPREMNWWQNAVRINEVYGSVTTIFGELQAGRMDDDWGLGMYLNDGDCLDCDYGSHVDRVQFRTRLFDINARAAVDFPDEGATTMSPSNIGQPYDVGQIDDATQYTLSVSMEPIDREGLELQRKRLLDDDAAVFNGGLFFRYRSQDGQFDRFDGEATSAEPYDATQPPGLIYRGMEAYIADLWVEFLYEPDFDTSARVGLEALGAFGSIDNATDDAVGLNRGPDEEPLNCFDEDVRANNPGRCLEDASGSSTTRDIEQFALALESEFRVGGPVSFGLNGGMASGGPQANWGLSGATPSYDTFRFNPDYYIDLILFRRVIGTVTNAYYANPFALVEFLETSDRRMEFQIDAIVSRAWDEEGTPAGDDAWLGVEFDAALRYLTLDLFQAELEAGILFPMGGLAAVDERERLTSVGNEAATFTSDIDPSIAWTVQTNLFWNF